MELNNIITNFIEFVCDIKNRSLNKVGMTELKEILQEYRPKEKKIPRKRILQFVVVILAVAAFTLYLVWQTLPISFHSDKRSVRGLKIFFPIFLFILIPMGSYLLSFLFALIPFSRYPYSQRLLFSGLLISLLAELFLMGLSLHDYFRL